MDKPEECPDMEGYYLDRESRRLRRLQMPAAKWEWAIWQARNDFLRAVNELCPSVAQSLRDCALPVYEVLAQEVSDCDGCCSKLRRSGEWMRYQGTEGSFAATSWTCFKDLVEACHQGVSLLSSELSSWARRFNLIDHRATQSDSETPPEWILDSAFTTLTGWLLRADCGIHLLPLVFRGVKPLPCRPPSGIQGIRFRHVCRPFDPAVESRGRYESSVLEAAEEHLRSDLRRYKKQCEATQTAAEARSVEHGSYEVSRAHPRHYPGSRLWEVYEEEARSSVLHFVKLMIHNHIREVEDEFSTAPWRQVPQKWQRQHYEWLALYQTLIMSPQQIASRYGSMGSDTVQRGIRSAAAVLGLTPRRGKRGPRASGESGNMSRPRN